MRVPHEDKVIHQTFNANKIEFVWLFTDHQLFIFGVRSDGSIYGQSGKVNDAHDWISEDGYPQFHFVYQKELITSGFQELWYYPNDFDFFDQGKELLPLIEDVVEFLK